MDFVEAFKETKGTSALNMFLYMGTKTICELTKEKDMKQDKNLLLDIQRIEISGNNTSGVQEDELTEDSIKLVKALNLRQQYMSASKQSFPKLLSRVLDHLKKDDGEFKGTRDEIKNKANSDREIQPTNSTDEKERTELKFEMKSGLVNVLMVQKGSDVYEKMDLNYPKLASFVEDYTEMIKLINDGPLRSFCSTRLRYLSSKFEMHVMMNNLKESEAQKGLSQTDFYHVMKVDTHVHASGCINPIDVLQFMRKKLLKKTKVYKKKDGTEIELKKVLKDLGKEPSQLNADLLDVHADRHIFRRFDLFNAKYNPLGQSELRDIFFKTDNFFGGQYFAELLKHEIEKLNKSGQQKAEYRLSIYGRSQDEWKKLALWEKGLPEITEKNVQWIIQVPRLYTVYKKDLNEKTHVNNFQEMLENIFKPLFIATSDPVSNRELHEFLEHVSGFDSVDDESKSENAQFVDHKKVPNTPDCWDDETNPDYAYYAYYMYANIVVLNNFRRQKGMHTFVFRPHCGEAGNPTHLVIGFLLAENIAHGLMLEEVPVLEYLFYLSQIGIAMSPMSNNALFLKYHSNPMPKYFSRGLNVSLSTDDPMQFHFTKEPLIEEYSTAAMMWNLSSCDLCEIAKNSVLQCGFRDEIKKGWIGSDYTEEGAKGNDATKTNVPSIRVEYRYETLVDELSCISRGCLAKKKSG